ncbi:MAG: glycine oxidase ThiO [Alphaproteobacteria bacterium]|nr:glycine oxidase ThiO [Alphaproteobacteria bacterium]
MSDVLILGGGIAGLSIARALTAGGASVTVLDRAAPGGPASRAAAGMLAPHAEFDDEDDPLRAFALAARAGWHDYAGALETETGTAIGYNASGAILIANDQAERARHIAFARRHPQEAQWLNAGEARHREPALAPDVEGALLLVHEGHVNNHLLVEALTRACANAGVRIHRTNATPIVQVEAARIARVDCDGIVWRPDVVIVAAGAWSGSIEGLPADAQIPVRPVKGEMIAVAAGTRPLRHLVWRAGTYLVGRAGLPLAIGATVEDAGFDDRLNPQSARQLFEAAKRAAPAAIGPEIVDHWCGFRPGTPDGLPAIGRGKLDNLIFATGQYRNGVLFAPSIAGLIARLILSDDDAALPAAFSPLRF